jgi:hypothetical protein
MITFNVKAVDSDLIVEFEDLADPDKEVHRESIAHDNQTPFTVHSTTGDDEFGHGRFKAAKDDGHYDWKRLPDHDDPKDGELIAITDDELDEA